MKLVVSFHLIESAIQPFAAPKPILSRLLAFFVLVGTTFAQTVTPPRAATVEVWPEGKMPGSGAMEPEAEVPRKDGFHRITNVSRPTLTFFRAPRTDDAVPGPAMIVCPGGGYGYTVIDKEGTEIAAWLNSAGISALVLKYRTPNNRAGALQDARRALSLARERAAEWNVDPQRLGIIGFSADGHLAARTSTSFGERSYPAIDEIDQKSCRPDFAALVYPAYLDDKAGARKVSAGSGAASVFWKPRRPIPPRRRKEIGEVGGWASRQRPGQSPLRVPLGGSVQSRPRPRARPRIPRRNCGRHLEGSLVPLSPLRSGSPAGRCQNRALLQHVRPALLLDEDHRRRPQIRRRTGDLRRRGIEERDGGTERSEMDNPEDCPRGRSEAESKVEGFEPPGGEREDVCAANGRRPSLREQPSQFVEKGAEVYAKA